MTKQAKIKKIAELRSAMEKAFYAGDWKKYNDACDMIGAINRSMMK